ncbi:MAG: hypothetical protein KDA29_03905 [Phycisphaerales bacterium]|nr:hypothetical protein [Phycisphaerales bacterium]
MNTLAAIACAAITLPAIADVQTSELTSQSPTWDRMSTSGIVIGGLCGDVAAQDSINDAVPFARFYIKATAPNTPLDVRVNSLEPTPIDFDPFVAVYCTGFDPSSPSMNLLHADDDSAGYPNAYAMGAAALDTDIAYIVIVSSYSNWAPSQYGSFEVVLGDNLVFFNPCPADLTGDGVLNFFDVSAFLVAYNAMDPIADFNSDGLFNFFDVSAFLISYNAGCP